MCTIAFYEPTNPKQLSDIANRWMPLGDFSFIPVSTKDLEEILSKNTNIIQAERKKYPDRYPKKFLEDHGISEGVHRVPEAGSDTISTSG